MKLHPLTPVLLPPVWTYTAGLFLKPLMVALGSTQPDLSAASWQAVGFTLSCTFSGWLLAQSVGQAPVPGDLTRRDWGQIRQKFLEEERAALQDYAQTVEMRFKLVIRNRTYNFPPGLTFDHLLHLAQVVASGQKPTDRALCPPFERGQGKSYQQMREYLIHNPAHGVGELAVELSGRGDWSLTRTGMQVLMQWVSYPYPTPPVHQKDVCLRLSKAIRSNWSNQNE